MESDGPAYSAPARERVAAAPIATPAAGIAHRTTAPSPSSAKAIAPSRPEPSELALADAVLADAKPPELLRLVLKTQELRVAINAAFDDDFEQLVTRGQTDGYKCLVDAYLECYAACDANLEGIAARLDGMLSRVVLAIRADEEKRARRWLDVQVLSQHLSVAGLDDEGRDQLKSRLTGAKAEVQALMGSIGENLEELLAELADM